MPRISLALAMVLFLASCGGGGDDERPKQRAPAKIPAAFTQQVDAICRDMGKQLRQLGTRPSRTRQESEYLAYTSDVSAIFLDGVRQFRSLKLPPGDAGARARRAIDATERRIEEYDAVSEELLTAVTENGDAKAAERRYARALGPAMHAPLRDELGATTCSFALRGGRRVARSRTS
jgi:hypothetical protein